MRRKSISIALFCLICLSAVCLNVVAENSEEEQVAGSEQYVASEDIIIPSVDDIRIHGYPQNARGETYGPDVWESTEEPDLILACNEFGQEGYVRRSDFDDGVTTLEEAAKHRPRQYTVDMYLQDGCTIIGTFTIGE